MRQLTRIMILLPVLSAPFSANAMAANSVVVESRSFSAGQNACTIGVYVNNDVPIQGLVVPLEIRTAAGAAFYYGDILNKVWNYGLAGRLYNSPLGPVEDPSGNWPPANVARRQAARPNTTSPCYNYIGLRSYSTWTVSGDTLSPDGFMFAAVSQGDPNLGEEIYLQPGQDQPGLPSLRFVVDLLPLTGRLEIDTVCWTPANVLVFVDEQVQPVWPEFTKGIIAVGQVGIAATPRVGDPPLTVFFSGINQTGLGMDSWGWDFGDGSEGVGQNPVHTYTQAGIYTVSMEAIQGDSVYTATYTNYITVNALQADFSASARHGAIPHGVTFTDLSIGAPTSWSWQFGDGAASSAQHPTHTYSTPGRYDVTLTTANASNSDVEKKLAYIIVDSVLAPDMVVTLYGNTRPRPGFDKCYTLIVDNSGSGVSTAGSVHLTLPTQANYKSSSPAATAMGNTLCWSIPAMNPGARSTFQACVNVPTSVPIGAELIATASVTGAEFELNLANNVREDREVVVGSIDPNDMFVTPRGCGPDSALISADQKLTYTILFENKPEATAEAIYVLVVDTLDPDLDWGTLQVGPTSKDNVLSVSFDPFVGELRWFFDGINLPPNVNPPEGEGFVSYTISPNPGLPDGTGLSSRSHIRFDYNPWLSAPEVGPIELQIGTCTTCDCPCSGDPECDGIRVDVLDVVRTVDVAFRNAPSNTDPLCPQERTDVDCNGLTDIVDVVKLVAVGFRSADAATEFCDACLGSVASLRTAPAEENALDESDIAGDWCGTQVRWIRSLKALESEKSPEACDQWGDCDDPAVRDTISTQNRIVKVIVHVIQPADCQTDCVPVTQATVKATIDQMNQDFSGNGTGVQFKLVATRFHSDPTYSSIAGDVEGALADISQLKSLYAELPNTHCNIYITCQDGTLLNGLATFPWDSDALTAQGGIWLNATAIGFGRHTATHEMGHCLGLWHTHHGVSEVDDCGPCYEFASGHEGNIRGDLAGDTPPTPTNWSCNPPDGDDCQGTPWGATQTRNYMGYAPQNCLTLFTPQQVRRMQCWSHAALTNWLSQ